MTLVQLIDRTNYGLATDGLSLSDFGKVEMDKRWNKKEAEGGFSQVIKDSEYINTQDKTPIQIWQEIQTLKADKLKELNA